VANENFNDELVAELVAIRDDAINGYMQHKNDFIALEMAYINELSHNQRKSLSNRRKSALTPNLIKPKVDKIVRDLMKSFFGNDELALIKADNKESEEDAKVSQALKKELKEYGRDKNLYTNLRPVAKEALVYGTAVQKIYWSSKENNIKLERCRLDDVYLDPYAPTTQDINYLVHRIASMTIADVEKQYAKLNVDWKQYVNASLNAQTNQNQFTDIGKFQRVEFHEVYRKKNGKWYVSTILNDDVVLRADKYLKDGLPFIIGTLDPQFVMINEPVNPVRAYGGAFIAPLMSLQNENTIKRNQQIDATDIQLNQRFITTKESGVREDDLISNRKKIVVDNIANIRELPIPRLNDSIFDVQQLSREAEEISGISKLSEGMGGMGNKTATEIEALQMQGSNVIDDISRAFNENFFRPLIQRIVLLIYKYKVSENFIDINRKRPLKQKIIINVGIGSINKMMQIDSIDKATVTVTQSLQLFMQMQDMARVKKYITMLDSLNIEKLKLLGQDSIIESAEEAEEQEEMMQQQQQAMMQPQQEVMQ